MDIAVLFYFISLVRRTLCNFDLFRCNLFLAPPLSLCLSFSFDFMNLTCTRFRYPLLRDMKAAGCWLLSPVYTQYCVVVPVWRLTMSVLNALSFLIVVSRSGITGLERPVTWTGDIHWWHGLVTWIGDIDIARSDRYRNSRTTQWLQWVMRIATGIIRLTPIGIDISVDSITDHHESELSSCQCNFTSLQSRYQSIWSLLS